jgi:fatty-acyl-CoA synthase
MACGGADRDVGALCRASLAGYKRSARVRFIAFEDFPRSTKGKILRHEMEAKMAAKLDSES